MILDLFKRKKEEVVEATSGKQKRATPGEVAEFYNQYNDKFLQTYGEVIQAYRTTDVTKLLDYEIESIGFEKGWKVLDAGCGVCGPATYFAQKCEVEVDAVTVSGVQVQEAEKKIADKNLADKVRVHKTDYHQLQLKFGKEKFDVVYFLESFGHSFNHALAIESAWNVLKPGGYLYIKDLFRKLAVLPEHQPKIDYEIGRINEAYRYNIAEMNTVLDALRKQGFVIMFLKTIDLKLEDFENLTISNDFQELTGIAKIDDWVNYIFPVEFYEIKCYKPQHDLQFGLSRYFLQNMYWMQVHNKKQEELEYGEL